MSSILPENLGDDSEGPWAAEEKAEPIIRVWKKKASELEAERAEKEEEEGGTKVAAIDIDPTMHIVEPDEEAEKWEKVNERKINYLLPPRPRRGSVAAPATSLFHGEQSNDYLGRSWTLPPPGTRPDGGEHECFIPKKCIKKYLGHTKGVQAILLTPNTGQLLLSASMDGTCKIWDVLKDQTLMRTYSGHSEAVKSIDMSNDGKSFLSSGYDRYIRLWDVETGKATATFSNRKMHYQGTRQST